MAGKRSAPECANTREMNRTVGGERVILWDLFGVLLRFQTREDYEKLASAVGADPEKLWPCYRGENRRLYDAGLVSAQEYWQRVGEEAGISIDWRIASQADRMSWKGRIEESVAYAHELHHRGVRMALLSNLPLDFVDVVAEREPWIEQIFEPKIFSAHAKLAKPGAEIFNYALQSLSAHVGKGALSPAQVLFIDDTPANVLAAEDLGYRTHHFASGDPENQRAGTRENIAHKELRRAVENFLQD